MIETLSSLILPVLFFAVGIIFLFGKKPYFDIFLQGAKEGLTGAIHLLPTLVALVVSVSMLRASGIIEFLSQQLCGVFSAIGLDARLLPLLLLRPVSGSASIAMLRDLFDTSGTDTLAGITASVLLGSSETMIYVMSVYYGSIGINKTRHTFPCAILVMMVSVISAILICRVFFA